MSEDVKMMPSWVPDWSMPRTTIDILGSQASPFFQKTPFTYQNHILRASGVSVATIEFVAEIISDQVPIPVALKGLKAKGTFHAIQRATNLTESRETSLCKESHLSILFRTIASCTITREMLDFPGSSNFTTLQRREETMRRCIEALHTIASSAIAREGLDFPGSSNVTTLQRRKETMRRCIEALKTLGDRDLPTEGLPFFDDLQTRCHNRSLFRTKEGDIGLGPRSMVVGDQVVVFLNCSCPMVLRPIGNGYFQVIGEACYQGFMDCEAFLGPVPGSLHRMVLYRGEDEYTRFVHLDSSSGDIHVEDPRLGPLPPNWTRGKFTDGKWFSTDYVDAETVGKLESLDYLEYPIFGNKVTGEMMTRGADPRINVEAFKARGVKIQTFNLV